MAAATTITTAAPHLLTRILDKLTKLVQMGECAESMQILLAHVWRHPQNHDEMKVEKHSLSSSGSKQEREQNKKTKDHQQGKSNNRTKDYEKEIGASGSHDKKGSSHHENKRTKDFELVQLIRSSSVECKQQHRENLFNSLSLFLTYIQDNYCSGQISSASSWDECSSSSHQILSTTKSSVSSSSSSSSKNCPSSLLIEQCKTLRRVFFYIEGHG